MQRLRGLFLPGRVRKLIFALLQGLLFPLPDLILHPCFGARQRASGDHADQRIGNAADCTIEQRYRLTAGHVGKRCLTCIALIAFISDSTIAIASARDGGGGGIVDFALAYACSKSSGPGSGAPASRNSRTWSYWMRTGDTEDGDAVRSGCATAAVANAQAATGTSQHERIMAHSPDEGRPAG